MTSHRHIRRTAANPTTSLATLAQNFTRCKARAGRRWRNYQTIDEKLDPEASAAAHQLWSDTVDEALGIADAISRQRPRDIGELLLQFETVWWWVLEDDGVLDGSARRWLGRFHRNLRWVARAS